MSVFLGQTLFHAGWKALHKNMPTGRRWGVVKSALPLTGWDEGLFQESLLGCPVSARAS